MQGRVLITGGTGLLAINWACAVRDRWHVTLGTHRHAVDLAGTTAIGLDLRDARLLAGQLDRLRPDLVVHTAGLTNVDRCEELPTAAQHANAELARNVAWVCEARNVALIHVSTDHLFAGTRSSYDESAVPQPLNEYGRSKLLAEQWVQEACPRAIILRTNFFGWGSSLRQSFSDWITYSLRAGKSLSLFDDVHYTPILASSLALAAHELVARDAWGVFNLVGDQRLSKYDFGVKLAERLELPRELIRRDSVQRGNLLANRPRDMSLDNAKAKRTLDRNLGTVDEYLTELRLQELQGRGRELFNAVSRCAAAPVD